MSDNIVIPGMSGQFKTNEVIKRIMEKKRKKLEKLEDDKEKVVEKKKGLSEIKAKTFSLQKASKNMYGYSAPFDEKIAVSSDEAFSASVDKKADIGEYAINIRQKASSHKVASSPQTKKYKVNPGVYNFTIGEKNIKVKFSGGTIDDFSSTIKKEGKNYLDSSVRYVTSKEQVLILESLKSGKENKIGFSDEKTKALFKKLGFYQDILAFNQKISLNQNNIYKKTQVNPQFSGDSLIADSGAHFQITINQPVAYREHLSMDIEMKNQVFTIDDKVAEKKLPTGPNFSEIGAITIEGISLKGEKTLVDIPPYIEKEEEKAPKEIIEDDNYIILNTNKRDVELGELDVTTENKKLTFNLGEILQNGEIVNSIEIKNNNTLKKLTVSSIRMYDESTFGGIKYTKELSRAQDSILEIDGLTVERDTNTIDNLLKGVTINVFGETDGEGLLQVDRDYEKIVQVVSDFIGGYNELLNLLNEGTDKNVNKETGELGLFNNEYGLISLANKMRIIMMNPYPTEYGDELSMLSQLGISTNALQEVDKTKLRGVLEMDADKFIDKVIEVMDKYPDGLKQLFGQDRDGDFVYDTGLGVELEKLLKSYTDPANGFFSTKSKSYDSDVENVEENIDNYKEKLDKEEQKLKEEFYKIEKAQKELQENSKKFDNFNKSSK